MKNSPSGVSPVLAIDLRVANEFIAAHHRHHKPAVGHKGSLGLYRGGSELLGVAVLGRPVARMADAKTTVEVTRLCVREGVRNGCSQLLAECRAWARRNGFRRVWTYTLPEEGGASLRGAGWTPTRYTKGGSWSRPSRARTDKAPITPKLRWEAWV